LALKWSESRIMKQNPEIEQELRELDSFLAGLGVTHPFRVPSGYFNTVAHDVLLSVSPRELKTEGSVPAGYFDGLASQILNRIQEEEFSSPSEILSDVLMSLPKIAPFSIPPGYFEYLPGIIQNRIKEEEGIEFLSPELLSVKFNNPYSLPANYFNQFSDTVIREIEKKNTPVVRMAPGRSIFKYAAAAVITGLLGLALFSNYGNKKYSNNTASINEATMKTAQSIIQKGEFDAVLSSLSDQDIVDYLQRSGEDVNAALVASVAASNKLPDQMEYILDDHTLNRVLDGVIKDYTYSN